MPPFENLFDKAKNFAKQTSDQTSKAAKVAKLKLNVVSLTSEKKKHLETIGQRVVSLINQGSAIDGSILQETVSDEMSQITRIDERIKELESEIGDLQANPDSVDVKDVTE